MKKSPTILSSEKSAEDIAFEEAYALGVEIMHELARIREKTGRGGSILYEQLSKKVFQPKGLKRSVLLSYVTYHGLIGSSPPPNLKIDLPEKDSLIRLARKKTYRT